MRRVTICNRKGLHARAAAKFVACAQSFDAEVLVAKDNEKVQADSIMELLMLSASQGTEIEIEAHGQDAEPAISALCELVEAGFHEVD
ncbi:HPr family phosphocarrier protein [Woodsholea maritima]|uniref:HPr family phosphocarrier protein n=1 Tax=Woodsholea maritima TaxID=240237 RepID=UPI0003820AA0|nr:HPr family phosphocarrier protein [Woodsholea maritima]